MFQVLDQMSELIYVVDLETYDLLYINQAGRDLFGLGDKDGGKCYQALQGLDSPCAFCTNPYLSENSFYTWEKTNAVVGRHFLFKDKLIDWNGKLAKVEIAFDMTEQEARRKTISDALELQNLVTECAKQLYEADENASAMEDVLAMSGRYLQSDRVYIFEIQGDKMSNTHEWCAPGVEPWLTRLQGIPAAITDRWKLFYDSTQSVIVVENVEELVRMDQEICERLKNGGIHSMIAVPLLLHKNLIGYLGVDNFSVQMQETTVALLTSIGYFIASMLRQQRTLTELERMSYYDSLTGIKNRNAYVQALQNPFTTPLGIVYVDINGMKEINNRQGHQSGDAVLQETARVLAEIFPGAGCYRIGADEFLAICEGTGEGAFQDMVQQFKNHFAFHSDFCVSLGASWASEASNLREIVFLADASMFEDKKAFYRGHGLSGRYRSQTDDILGLTAPSALERKFEAGQFEVYFQPQVDVKTRRLTGAEALVRYRDDFGKLYPPSHFIPVLEEARLISLLDFHVFERVCSQLQSWRAADIDVVPVSTNFSRHTLAVEGFADRLEDICRRYQIGRELIEVEITETVEADDRSLFLHAVDQLRQNEFRISIDDFGVNNANIALLTDIYFHVLKIDKHVVDNLCGNKKSDLLVSALIGICHQMGIRVIAEGVETQDQLEILQKLECDVVQGYYYGRPIPASDFQDQFLNQKLPLAAAADADGS